MKNSLWAYIGIPCLFFMISCNRSQKSSDSVNTPLNEVYSRPIYTYEDSTNKLSLNQVLTQKFKALNHHIASYKINNNTHWALLEFDLDADKNTILECNSGLLDFINIYIFDSNNHLVFSDSLKWDTRTVDRKIKTWRNVFQLDIKTSGKYKCYIKTFKNNGSLHLPFILWESQNFYKSQYFRALYFGFAFGIFSIIMFLSISIFISLKEPKYLYYGMYIMFISIWRLWIEGFVMEILLDTLPSVAYPFFANIPMVIGFGFLILFYREFVLKTYKKHRSPLLKTCNILLIAMFSLLTMSFISKGHYTMYYGLYYVYYSLGSILIIYMIISMVMGFLQKNTNAFIYLLSSTPFMLYAIVVSLSNNKVINVQPMIYDNMLFTVFFEVIILTFALGVEFKNLMVQRRVLLVENNNKEKQLFESTTMVKNAQIQKLEAEQNLKKEKERISRDLHDSIGTELSNIIYNLDYVYLLSIKNKYPEITEKIEYLQKYSRQSIQQLRSAIWILNTENVTIQEFVAKLHPYILDQIESYNGISYKINIEEGLESLILPSQHSLFLFRISQESISNILKHAEAKNIKISWKREKEKIIYQISDDGKGMNLEESMLNESYGLKNIYQRISELKEEIEIKSSQLTGTEITIKLTKVFRK